MKVCAVEKFDSRTVGTAPPSALTCPPSLPGLRPGNPSSSV